MATIQELIFAVFISVAVVAVAWPSLLIVGNQTDDPDNWLAAFFFGVFTLLWVFVL